MLSLTAGSERLHKRTTDTLYHASWRHNLLAFKNEPLQQVARTIRDRYGFRVEFADPHLQSLRFTGAVPSHDLPLALRMVATAFTLDTHTATNTLLIKSTE